MVHGFTSASHYYRYQAGGYGEVSGVYLKTNDDITVTKNKNDVALFGDTSLVLLEDKTSHQRLPMPPPPTTQDGCTEISKVLSCLILMIRI